MYNVSTKRSIKNCFVRSKWKFLWCQKPSNVSLDLIAECCCLFAENFGKELVDYLERVDYWQEVDYLEGVVVPSADLHEPAVPVVADTAGASAADVPPFVVHLREDFVEVLGC